MKTYPRKIRKIAENTLNLITDIRDRYVIKYSLDASKWDNELRQLYFLNCDMEIYSYLKKNKVKINKSAMDFGLSYGILILKNQLIYNYNNYQVYEDNYLDKEKMFDNINDITIDFILNGV